MRFCLLSRFHRQHGNSSFIRRILAEAQKMGHTLDLIDPSEITLSFNGPQAFPVIWKGLPIPEYDLIHYAVRWDDDFTWEIIETLTTWGRKVLPANRVPLGDNVTMARLMARRGVNMPRSWVLATAEQLPLVIPEIQFPCLFRVRKGVSGRQVYFANHSQEATQIAHGIGRMGQNFMIQEVPVPIGEDIRVFVVGHKIICAIERMAKPGFARPIEDGNPRVLATVLTPEEEKLVLSTAQIYNAPYAAVSILRRHNAPTLMLELARVPALEEAEKATGTNIAGEILKYLEQAAHESIAS